MSRRKGIVLAGGTGSRLHPLTLAVSKQLMPVYDKPLIYYPISTLMLAGIQEMLIITTPDDQPAFRRLLGDGSQWGLQFDYASQAHPEGIAQALIVADEYLGGRPSAMILGDNIFFGHGLAATLTQAGAGQTGATIFVCQVSEPERYGVAVFDQEGRLADIIEKPKTHCSDYAVTGLYFFDGDAPNMSRQLKPSARGELEITDLNKMYLENGNIATQMLGRGTAWLDTGTHEALMSASEFVRVIEQRQGLKISCPEELAWRLGHISDDELRRLAGALSHNEYGRYLERLVGQSARDG